MMIKKDLINAIAERSGLTKRDSKIFVNTLISVLPDILAEEGCVNLNGFGKIEVRTRKARDVRHPSSGQIITIPARNVVSIKMSNYLKEKINK